MTDESQQKTSDDRSSTAEFPEEKVKPMRFSEREVQEEKTEPAVKAQAITLVQNINNFHVNALGQNHLTIAPVNTTVGQIGCSSGEKYESARRLPGWPAKWEVPAELPAPFDPLGFEVSLAELESAVSSLSPETRAACGQGDVLAVVQLLMGILRRVHARPESRNVYMNPRRADQALVYIPDCWVTRPLDDAGRALFRRIADVLGCLPKTTQRTVQEAAVGVRQSCEEKLPQLAKASRGALSAHLENVRLATAGGDWMCADGEEAQLAFFGKEWTGHLKSAYLTSAAEMASEVFTAGDVTEAKAAEQTSRALAECMRYVLQGQTRNFTVLPSPEDPAAAVYVHEHVAGWVKKPRQAAEQVLFRRMAAILDDQLDEAVESSLVALRPWLRERCQEVLDSAAGRSAAQHILDQSMASAARYYGMLAPRANARDRREMARKLVAPTLALAGRKPAREKKASAGALTLARAAAEPAPSLRDEDLEELLGFPL